MTAAKRESLLVIAAFIVAAIVLTLPLALNLKRALPSDHSDTLLISWIIGWDADRLRHGLRGLWDAPIFFPYRGTLAFSETMLGLAVFVAPVYWLTADPVLTYNVAFLFAFAIAGVGMYLLARELTGSRAAAFASGMYYAFGPFRMSQYAHVQMVATGWIPIALFGLHRYFATRRPRWLALFAGAWILQTLSNMYVGYFIALPIAAVIADGVWRAPEHRARAVLHLAAAGLLVAAALAPLGAAYFRARTDYHQVRHIDEVVAHSADLRSYLVGKNSVGVWRWLPTAVGIDPEKELFPGLFAAGFAATRSGHRRRGSAAPTLGPRLRPIAAAAASSLSLGPHLRIWGTVVTTHGPYAMAARDRAGHGRHARPGALRHHRRRGAVGAGGVRRRLAVAAAAPPVPAAGARRVRGDARRGRLGHADRHGRLQRPRPSGRSRHRVLAGGPRSRGRAAPADSARG